MTEEFVLFLGREALFTTLLAAAPMLAAALFTGLIVAVFQATTQIQEQTLSFVPKIVAVLLSVALLGPWIYSIIIQFASNLLTNIHQYV